MGKTVLIVSSSPRKNGNSETLADAFAKGAREAGHSVEIVHLREKRLGFCKGCLACLKLVHGVIQDDAVEIAAKMHDADVLAFAMPVYYYSVCGQNHARPRQPAFRLRLLIHRGVSGLATAAESGRSTFDGAKKAVQGWVDCFPRCAFAGTVFAGGVNGVGDIAGHPALEQARRMGMESRRLLSCAEADSCPEPSTGGNRSWQLNRRQAEMLWGTLPPNSHSSMTMCCSARCGAEKTSFPFETAAW